MLLNCVLEKTLESPLDCKEIQPGNPKENQSWIFIGRTDAISETPIVWPPDAKNWLIRKDPDAGKDYRQEDKRTTEDEMVRWHHWLTGHEFGQALGDGDGQGSLTCCSQWVSKSWTRLSDWTELNGYLPMYFVEETEFNQNIRRTSQPIISCLSYTWASLKAQLIKNPPAIRKIPWRSDRLPTPVLGLPLWLSC